jgi:hypothetical protein
MPICPKLGTLIRRTQEEIFRKVKTPKSVLGLRPGEDGFCSSETKHDRRTAPRPKSFVSAGTSHDSRPRLQKIVLGSSPGSSENKHNRKRAPKPKQFASARRFQEQRSQARKLS